MTNLERLKISIEGIQLEDEKLKIYLLENDLEGDFQYNPKSSSEKKNILKASLSVLEEIANNPQLMREYKTEDMSISRFSRNLQMRIEYLQRKIKLMANDENVYQDGASFCYMFNE